MAFGRRRHHQRIDLRRQRHRIGGDRDRMAELRRQFACDRVAAPTLSSRDRYNDAARRFASAREERTEALARATGAEHADADRRTKSTGIRRDVGWLAQGIEVRGRDPARHDRTFETLREMARDLKRFSLSGL